MEKQLLTEIFGRYLEGVASADEIRLLLDHFKLKKESAVLRQLIKEAYETNPAEEITPQIRQSLAKVKASLQEQIVSQQQSKLRHIRLLKYSVAAMITIAVSLAYLYRDVLRALVNPVTYQTVYTQKGDRKQLVLADGSIIWLAPQSSIRFPDRFSGSTREVKLSGEAFFDVAKDKTHPFIVHSGAVDTKVLGTTFNIHAYSDDPLIAVTLLTGKVTLHTVNGKGEQLQPNERATYDKATAALVKKVYPQATQMLDRRDGIYHYDGTAVLQIIADLSRDYNISIVTEGDFTNCTFYGDYHEGDDPYLFLRKVCRVINAQIIRNETGIKIIGKGC